MKTNFSRLLCVVGLGVAAPALAQQTPPKENRVVPAFETFFEKAAFSKEAYFDYQKEVYSLPAGTQFELLDSTADALGMVHYRYSQLCKGHVVEGAMLLLHTRNNRVKSVNGDVFAIPNENQTPLVSEAAALQNALLQVPAQSYAWQQMDKRLYPQTAPPAGHLVWAPVGGKPTAPFQLAYKFDVYAVQPLHKAFVFISATDGRVVWEQAGLADVHVKGTATTKYSGVRTLSTDSLAPGSYILQDESRGGGIATFDMQSSKTYYVDFTSTTNSWTDTVGNRGAGHDVHWGLQRVYDYYDTVHNRKSYDNTNSPLVAFVHYDLDYANAFWNGSVMAFGDGNTTSGLRPLTSLDVVGHEATHAVTQHTASLIYQDESGALNESFSDIFSKCIEKRYKPLTFSWNIGKEISANPNGMRNMANPNVRQHPDTYFGTHWYTGTLDNGGVHYNSGVQNFWFYLICNGKTGVNDFNQPYTVTGIGMDKAAAIAYRTLSVYLTSYSMYADARQGSIQAAKDLYGECANEVVQVTNAWHAVGLGGAYPTANLPKAVVSVPATINAGEAVQLSSNSVNAPDLSWFVNGGYVGNSNPQTHTFSIQGMQEVTLVAVNATCQDTAKMQIEVLPPLGVAQVPADLGFGAYPNPATAGFALKGAAWGGVQYQLTDFAGRVLVQKSFTASGGYEETVSTEALAAGLYQLSVTTAGETRTLQIAVKH